MADVIVKNVRGHFEMFDDCGNFLWSFQHKSEEDSEVADAKAYLEELHKKQSNMNVYSCCVEYGVKYRRGMDMCSYSFHKVSARNRAEAEQNIIAHYEKLGYKVQKISFSE